ncbi:MAG TPA: hypothetical protein VF880_05070 [Actinomycetes bacterium]
MNDEAIRHLAATARNGGAGSARTVPRHDHDVGLDPAGRPLPPPGGGRVGRIRAARGWWRLVLVPPGGHFGAQPGVLCLQRGDAVAQLRDEGDEFVVGGLRRSAGHAAPHAEHAFRSPQYATVAPV